MNRSSILLVLFLVGLVFSCSPAQHGDFQYVSQDEVPAGKAVVYLYRPPSIATAGLCNVALNDEVIGALNPGQYTVCFFFARQDSHSSHQTVWRFRHRVRESEQAVLHQTKMGLQIEGFQSCD